MKNCKEEVNENTILELIISNRPFLMGVAIIIVIIYHLFCWVYNPIGLFNIGYVGVDIFLFLSGLGLSYSYEKNSIIKFYKNRIIRIYPLYLISVLTTYLFFQHNWSTFDLFANISTIGFYTKGGIFRYDWYLESLFTLYISYPLFYFYGKIKMEGLTILLLVISFVLYKYNIQWWYDCILARLPIFLYGIIFRNCMKSYKIVSFVGLFSYLPCRNIISPFLASSGLAIPLILASLLLMKYLPTKFLNILLYAGKHTLEIYIANLFVFWLFEVTNYTVMERTILFIFIQLIATITIIRLNRILVSIIRF